MAKLTLDLSGISGLVERHQGDLNDTTVKPALRYLGSEGQFADGIYNPFKKLGYMSPANNSFVSLTGTIAAGINSIVYDASGDILYFAESGENILKLDGMDDTSLSNYLTITSGDDIKDMLLYEVNGEKSLIYLIDSFDAVTWTSSTVRTGGQYVGFKTIDTTQGITLLENKLTDDGLGDGSIYWEIVSTAGENGNPLVKKLAQQINTSDFTSSETSADGTISLSGVEMLLSREGGTGSGITMKLSVQGQASASVAPYTSRGAWSNAVTDYAINDTVTNGGSTWQCIEAHSAAAAANDEPGVGSNWEQYWNLFGAPDGSELGSATVALSSISNGNNASRTRYRFTFSSPISLTDATNYWLVLEESGSVMSGTTDQCSWMATINGTGNYPRHAKHYITSQTNWESNNANGDTLTSNHDDMDFTLILNRDDSWSSSVAQGKFAVDTGTTPSYLYLADNGLVYWVAGNNIHTLDGTLTGGPVGRGAENVLVFTSYTSIPDIAETRSRMYIAVQTANITTATDPRTYTANKSGVFVWDRRSQILGSTDFYPTSGAQEIKALFTSSAGDVKAITIGNSGFTEIRGINGNQYAVIQSFEKNGYPKDRRSISQIGGLSVWLGINGVFYGYGSIVPGEKEALYKFGTMAGQASVNAATLATGPIFVGNEYASGPQQAVFFAWTDTNSTEVQKWYPNGEGTLNSVLQVGHVGDIYTLVKYLPELSKVNTLTIYCAPVPGTASTVIATAKIYFNQSTTVGMTKSITQAQASRGYIHWDINKPNVNSIQVEFEYNTSDALGTNDFSPSLGILDYSPTNTHTPDGG